MRYMLIFINQNGYPQSRDYNDIIEAVQEAQSVVTTTPDPESVYLLDRLTGKGVPLLLTRCVCCGRRLSQRGNSNDAATAHCVWCRALWTVISIQGIVSYSRILGIYRKRGVFAQQEGPFNGGSAQ